MDYKGTLTLVNFDTPVSWYPDPPESDVEVGSKGSNTVPLILGGSAVTTADIQVPTAEVGDYSITKFTYNRTPNFIKFTPPYDGWEAQPDTFRSNFSYVMYVWGLKSVDTESGEEGDPTKALTVAFPGPMLYGSIPPLKEMNLVSSDIVSDAGLFTRHKEEIEFVGPIIPNSTKGGPVKQFLQAPFAYDQDAATARNFVDTTFRIEKPIESKTFNTSLEAYGMFNPIKISSVYNFHLAPYETLINQRYEITSETEGTVRTTEASEYLMPNIYALVADASQDEARYKDQYTLTYDKTTRGSNHSFEELGVTIMPDGNSPSLNDISTYLQAFARLIGVGTATRVIQDISPDVAGGKYATTGISINSLDILKMAEDNKFKFPMYNEIDIPTADMGTFGALLKQYGYFDPFMKAVMLATAAKTDVWNSNTDTRQVEGSTYTIFKRDNKVKSIKGALTLDSIEDEIRKDRLVKLDLREYLESPEELSYSIQPGKTDRIISTVPKQLNSYVPSSQALQDTPVFGMKKTSDTSVLGTIKGVIFKSKMKKFINDNMRTIEELLKGKLGHSEILFFEIVKWRSTEASQTATTDQFIQNVYIPNDGSANILKYIDTQVTYGTKYYYQIFAHTLVIGNKYKRYLNTAAGHGLKASLAFDDMSERMTWTFENEAVINLVRVPYYNTLTTIEDGVTRVPLGPLQAPWDQKKVKPENLQLSVIYDNPPVFPNVDIVPYRGVNNKVLINLNFNAGEYILNPVTFSDEEEQQIEKIRQHQKLPSGGVLYKTDEYVGFFEVLRIAKRPESYQDFAPVEGSRRALLNSLETTSHIDSLIPNRDYYYTFRVKDIHGNTSNPTPIYQVRIVDIENVAPYAVISSFFIEEKEKKKEKTTTTLMKYIKIQPRFFQAYLDQENILQYGSVDFLSDSALQLGAPTKESDVFGKKFKFRLTSKKTGRMIDLNVKVKIPVIQEKTDETS